jgi:hypothetical protein
MTNDDNAFQPGTLDVIDQRVDMAGDGQLGQARGLFRRPGMSRVTMVSSGSLRVVSSPASQSARRDGALGSAATRWVSSAHQAVQQFSVGIALGAGRGAVPIEVCSPG